VSARRGSGQSNVVLGMPQISCKRVFEATVGSRRPLLLHNATPDRKITTSAMHERPFTRAAGVSPPWIFKPRLQVPYAGFPRCELGESTGGLRPPLLYCRANVRRQKAMFTMHERQFTGAAGVSPPWIFKPRLQVSYAGFPRCELGESTGGLRPPLLCCRANVRRQKSDFCDAHTNVHKSGGCQPAVGLGSRTWSAVCRKSLASAFSKPRSAYADRS
jgi:hypothetical protein